MPPMVTFCLSLVISRYRWFHQLQPGYTMLPPLPLYCRIVITSYRRIHPSATRSHNATAGYTLFHMVWTVLLLITVCYSCPGHTTLPPVTLCYSLVTLCYSLVTLCFLDPLCCSSISTCYRWLDSVPHRSDYAFSAHTLLRLTRPHYHHATAGHALLQPGYTMLQPGYTMFPRSTLLQTDHNTLPLFFNLVRLSYRCVVRLRYKQVTLCHRWLHFVTAWLQVTQVFESGAVAFSVLALLCYVMSSVKEKREMYLLLRRLSVFLLSAAGLCKTLPPPSPSLTSPSPLRCQRWGIADVEVRSHLQRTQSYLRFPPHTLQQVRIYPVYASPTTCNVCGPHVPGG